MYLSVVTLLVGEAVLFLSSGILIEAITFFLCAHGIITLFEEPILLRQFGAYYENYLSTPADGCRKYAGKPLFRIHIAKVENIPISHECDLRSRETKVTQENVH